MEKQYKYGFVYIWYDRGRKMYYIGSHWGTEDDGYICSSNWMRDAYRRRPEDFQKLNGQPSRRILMRIYSSRLNLLEEEQYWLNMIKNEKMAIRNSSSQKRKNVRYYNITKVVQRSWHYDDEKRKSVGEKVSIAKKGKSIGPQPQKGSAISKAKKGKALTEEHKVALRVPKSTGAHSDERKTLISEKSKEFWNSPEGIALKEKRKIEGRSEESKLRLSQTLKEKGHKPSQEAIQSSIKKCSKTYKVISPSGEEMTITNLKQFCRKNGLIDINMVRSSGSKGWKAYLIN